jgi:uncharacterized protein
MMKYRYLESYITQLSFAANKMAFIAGPRQSGKTTMAKTLLRKRGAGQYYNWDEIGFRRLWASDPTAIVPEHGKQKPILILDELHKAKLWKRSLKGIYDTMDNAADIIVTGSARLNVYRKGSDSLLGRYYYYRLHPFSLAELERKNNNDPLLLIEQLLSKSMQHSKVAVEHLNLLMKFGPFPEPLLAANEKILNLWRRGRTEKIIREDLRDLSRLPELSQVEMLAALLPERIASILSIRSLSEDLEVAYNTIKRWLNYLRELYYVFELKPYAKSLPRAIKKEGKLYLWDWSEIKDPGARFENLIASHLLKYCHFLTDIGEGTFELYYLRNKAKQEIDFLIVKDKQPWLPIEAKLNHLEPSPNWQAFMKHLPCEVAIQVTYKQKVYRVYDFAWGKLLIISADMFLRCLI